MTGGVDKNIYCREYKGQLICRDKKSWYTIKSISEEDFNKLKEHNFYKGTNIDKSEKEIKFELINKNNLPKAKEYYVIEKFYAEVVYEKGTKSKKKNEKIKEIKENKIKDKINISKEPTYDIEMKTNNEELNKQYYEKYIKEYNNQFGKIKKYKGDRTSTEFTEMFDTLYYTIQKLAAYPNIKNENWNLGSIINEFHSFSGDQTENTGYFQKYVKKQKDYVTYQHNMSFITGFLNVYRYWYYYNDYNKNHKKYIKRAVYFAKNINIWLFYLYEKSKLIGPMSKTPNYYSVEKIQQIFINLFYDHTVAYILDNNIDRPNVLKYEYIQITPSSPFTSYQQLRGTKFIENAVKNMEGTVTLIANTDAFYTYLFDYLLQYDFDGLKKLDPIDFFLIDEDYIKYVFHTIYYYYMIDYFTKGVQSVPDIKEILEDYVTVSYTTIQESFNNIENAGYKKIMKKIVKDKDYRKKLNEYLNGRRLIKKASSIEINSIKVDLNMIKSYISTIKNQLKDSLSPFTIEYKNQTNYKETVYNPIHQNLISLSKQYEKIYKKNIIQKQKIQYLKKILNAGFKFTKLLNEMVKRTTDYENLIKAYNNDIKQLEQRINYILY